MTATNKASAHAYRAIVYDLAQEASNAVALISGRMPLQDLIGSEERPSHLITLPTLGKDGGGIFGGIQADQESSPTLGDACLAAALANHGHAFRRFITKLQARMLADEAKLRQSLSGWRSLFLEIVRDAGISVNDQWTARHFASIYAAGRLAKAMGILPKSFRCLDAARHCLELSQTAPALGEAVPFADQLLALCQSGKVLRVDKAPKKLSGLDKGKIRAAVGGVIGVLHNYGSLPELRIPTENITRAFPNWAVINGRKDVRDLLKMDGRNLCAKAVLAPGMAATRLFCFRIPADAPAWAELSETQTADKAARSDDDDGLDSLFAD